MESSNVQRFKRRIPIEDEDSCLPKAKARRCLFGAVNHDDLIKDLRKITEKLNAESQKRWNFDFAADTPLVGRFEWMKVDLEDVPVAYKMPLLTKRLSSGLNLKCGDDENAASNRVQPMMTTTTTTTTTTQPSVVKATHGDKENVVNSNVSRSQQKLGSKRKASPLKKSTQKDKSIYRTQSKISDHFQQRKAKSEVRRKLDL